MFQAKFLKSSDYFGKDRTKIFFHLITWAVLFLLPLFFVWRSQIPGVVLLFLYFNLFINALIFYCNYLLLLPIFYFPKERIKYLISLIVMLTLFGIVSYWINLKVYNGLVNSGQIYQLQDELIQKGIIETNQQNSFPFNPASVKEHLIHYLPASLLLIFLSLGARVIERNKKIEKEQTDLRQEKLSAELALLRHQISPHFLFNTLNNIYSLSTINPEDSQSAILKLSQIMRYLLYDTEISETKLSDEINLLKNYIDLIKLRLDKYFKLIVHFPEEYEDYTIPPLLFIPFIENAFKHGVSFKEDSFIDISLTTSDNLILFKTINSISQTVSETGLESSGIGLNNVKKRLDLLLPGKYDLVLNKTDKTFEVLLNIRINS